MDIMIFSIFLFTLQIAYWIVGKRASRGLKDKKDYFLAGKNVQFFPLMMTLLATLVGGGLFLGTADEAYQFGWSVFLYPVGSALGLIVLGFGIGKKLAEYKVSTVAQIFEVAYGSKLLKKFASILSILSLFMILVAQILASHKFLMSLGFNNLFFFIGFWGIVIAYTTRGGMKAVISTDMVQAGIFSVILIICFLLAIFSEPFSNIRLSNFENFSLASSKVCAWLFMPLFFIIIGQDVAQRCFAGGSSKIVSRASLCAGFFLLMISMIPVFFGVLAKALGIAIPSGNSVLMEVITYLTNKWITALAGCAILAAIISTATSLINSISSNIANDFNIKALNQKYDIPIIRGITAIISVSALIFAFYFNNIIDILIQSYDIFVSCLFVSIISALFKKNNNFLAALYSIGLGALGFILFRCYPVNFPKEILSITLSLFGYCIGEVITSYRKKSSKIS